MVYVNNREIMDWQKTIMNEGILSFKSPIEPKIKYTIAFCSLHKDPKNPWFVMAKTTKIGCKKFKSRTFGIEGSHELVRQLQKLKRMGYINCPTK